MKKIYYTITLLSVNFAVMAQDTLYFDGNYNEVSANENYKFYNVIFKSQQDTNSVTVKKYENNGHNYSSIEYYPYFPESERKTHGQAQSWYESGVMRSNISYYNDKKHGKLNFYWENGKVKREEIYAEGEMVAGSVWDVNGNPVTYYPLDQLANCPGWTQYLNSNLRYPSEARKQKIEGRVIVKFVVEKDGSISNISILNSVHKDLDAEVLRIVKASPRWEPGKQDGIPVRSYKTLPITFKLE